VTYDHSSFMIRVVKILVVGGADRSSQFFNGYNNIQLVPKK